MINLIVSCFASFILAVMYLKEPGNDYNSAIVNYYGSKLKVFFHIFFYSFIILFACSFINWQFFIVLMIGVFLYLFFLNESLKGKPSQKFQEEAKIQKEKAKEKARIQKEKARIQKEEAEEKARIQKEEADKQQNIKFQMISNLKKTILIFDSNIYMNSIYEDLFHFLPSNICVLLNDTKVIKARLFGKKASGGEIEILLNTPLQDNLYTAYIRGKVKAGTQLFFANDLSPIELTVLPFISSGISTHLLVPI